VRSQNIQTDRDAISKCIEGKNLQANVTEEYVEWIKIRRKLGDGAFGIVYHGYDSVLQKDFAIKTIDKDLLLHATADAIEDLKKSFEMEQRVGLNKKTNFCFCIVHCFDTIVILYNKATPNTILSTFNCF
jgi:serine/threonine protein kinase